ERVELAGPLDGRQLIVSGTYADGSVRDLTAEAVVRAGDLVNVSAGFVTARSEGEGTLVVEAAGLTANVKVSVRMSPARPVNFRQDVRGAVSVGGCNPGACHGSPNGRGGFNLSLRGYDPEADYRQLTHDLLGRRVSTVEPDASLILRKPLGK